MPPLLTTNAVVMCPHGGTVALIPKQLVVEVAGGLVLCEPDLVGASIAGCTQPATPVTKPCTTVVATLPGSSSARLLVAGRPPYFTTLIATTDGVPPAKAEVVVPGAIHVQAS